MDNNNQYQPNNQQNEPQVINSYKEEFSDAKQKPPVVAVIAFVFSLIAYTLCSCAPPLALPFSAIGFFFAIIAVVQSKGKMGNFVLPAVLMSGLSLLISLVSVIIMIVMGLPIFWLF